MRGGAASTRDQGVSDYPALFAGPCLHFGPIQPQLHGTRNSGDNIQKESIVQQARRKLEYHEHWTFIYFRLMSRLRLSRRHKDASVFSRNISRFSCITWLNLNHSSCTRQLLSYISKRYQRHTINGPALSIFRLARHHRKVDDFQGIRREYDQNVQTSMPPSRKSLIA